MKKAQNSFVLLGSGPALRVNWRARCNTLSESEMEVSHAGQFGVSAIRKPPEEIPQTVSI